MKLLLSVSVIEVLFLLCKSHVSKGNNYLQLLRSQKFIGIETKNNNNKLYQNHSEDLDELDSYEEEEEIQKLQKLQKQSDIKKEKEIENFIKSNLNKNTDTLEFKNLENNFNKKENEYVNNLSTGKTCSIYEKGILDVAINEINIFNLKKYLVEISSSSIIINENEINKNNIKTIPFESIKLPIETIEETRECWKLKTINDNFMFCEKNKNERDVWIHNILKALFCYNTNNLKIEENNLFQLNNNFQLPKESTIEQRMKNKNNNLNANYKSEDIPNIDFDINQEI